MQQLKKDLKLILILTLFSTCNTLKNKNTKQELIKKYIKENSKKASEYKKINSLISIYGNNDLLPQWTKLNQDLQDGLTNNKIFYDMINNIIYSYAKNNFKENLELFIKYQCEQYNNKFNKAQIDYMRKIYSKKIFAEYIKINDEDIDKYSKILKETIKEIHDKSPEKKLLKYFLENDIKFPIAYLKANKNKDLEPLYMMRRSSNGETFSGLYIGPNVKNYFTLSGEKREFNRKEGHGWSDYEGKFTIDNEEVSKETYDMILEMINGVE